MFLNLICSNVDETDWAEFTLRNKNNADKCINASIQLRTKTDSLLRQGVEDLQTQLCKTDKAFQTNLKVLVAVKEKMQTELSDVIYLFFFLNFEPNFKVLE